MTNSSENQYNETEWGTLLAVFTHDMQSDDWQKLRRYFSEHASELDLENVEDGLPLFEKIFADNSTGSIDYEKLDIVRGAFEEMLRMHLVHLIDGFKDDNHEPMRYLLNWLANHNDFLSVMPNRSARHNPGMLTTRATHEGADTTGSENVGGQPDQFWDNRSRFGSSHRCHNPRNTTTNNHSCFIRTRKIKCSRCGKIQKYGERCHGMLWCESCATEHHLSFEREQSLRGSASQISQISPTINNALHEISWLLSEQDWLALRREIEYYYGQESADNLGSTNGITVFHNLNSCVHIGGQCMLHFLSNAFRHMGRMELAHFVDSVAAGRRKSLPKAWDDGRNNRPPDETTSRTQRDSTEALQNACLSDGNLCDRDSERNRIQKGQKTDMQHEPELELEYQYEHESGPESNLESEAERQDGDERERENDANPNQNAADEEMRNNEGFEEMVLQDAIPFIPGMNVNNNVHLNVNNDNEMDVAFMNLDDSPEDLN